MKKLMLAVNRFIHDEEGATAIEYGLIAALISIVMLVALTGVGQGVQHTFVRICGALNTALTAGGAGGVGVVCPAAA